MAGNYDDVSVFELSAEREQVLVEKQTECCLMWTTSTGDPDGVYLNYFFHEGSFWLTATEQRKRVRLLPTGTTTAGPHEGVEGRPT